MKINCAMKIKLWIQLSVQEKFIKDSNTWGLKIGLTLIIKKDPCLFLFWVVSVTLVTCFALQFVTKSCLILAVVHGIRYLPTSLIYGVVPWMTSSFKNPVGNFIACPWISNTWYKSPRGKYQCHADPFPIWKPNQA